MLSNTVSYSEVSKINDAAGKEYVTVSNDTLELIKDVYKRQTLDTALRLSVDEYPSALSAMTASFFTVLFMDTAAPEV